MQLHTEIMHPVKPATLRSFHLESGRPSKALADQCIDLIIWGGKQVYGQGIKLLLYFITSGVLINKYYEEGINVKAALSMEFAFSRSEQFTWDIWSLEFPHFLLSNTTLSSIPYQSPLLTLPSTRLTHIVWLLKFTLQLPVIYYYDQFC